MNLGLGPCHRMSPVRRVGCLDSEHLVDSFSCLIYVDGNDSDFLGILSTGLTVAPQLLVFR